MILAKYLSTPLTKRAAAIAAQIAASLLTGCASAPTINLNNQLTAPVITQPCQSALYQPLPNGLLRAKGEGASSQEALRVALANIAIQMQVTVHSQSESTQSKTGNKSQQQFIRNIRSSSQQVFTDYNILCESPNTVVISFDNRPLTERVQASLQTHFSLGWQLQGPNWLRNSPSLSSIKNSGSNEVVRLSLYKLNNFWYLGLNNKQIKLREKEWRFLYTLPKSQNTTTEKNDNDAVWISNEFNQRLATTLRTGDEFRIQLNSNINKNYFSLLYIQSDGSIYPVRLNQPLSHHSIPKPPGIFSAEAESALSIDDYIILLSNHTIVAPASRDNLTAWLNLTQQYDSLGLRIFVKQ